MAVDLTKGGEQQEKPAFVQNLTVGTPVTQRPPHSPYLLPTNIFKQKQKSSNPNIYKVEMTKRDEKYTGWVTAYVVH